ncbi:MAG: hypothetical protein ACD_22C00241G0005 [uncultured bacterium]|nr:MAG: hypothetical protein ACD_22C00241G0005 [uncultured bacterium]
MLSYIKASFFMLFFIVICYLVVNSIDYFDITSGCYIAITGDVLKGNEDTIRTALRNLKYEDSDSYNRVCGYVSKIIENTCLNSDPRFGYPKQMPDGCYIKGSKTIYLKPVEKNSDEVVTSRMEELKRLSEFSKEFWQEF